MLSWAADRAAATPDQWHPPWTSSCAGAPPPLPPPLSASPRYNPCTHSLTLTQTASARRGWGQRAPARARRDEPQRRRGTCSGGARRWRVQPSSPWAWHSRWGRAAGGQWEHCARACTSDAASMLPACWLCGGYERDTRGTCARRRAGTQGQRGLLRVFWPCRMGVEGCWTWAARCAPAWRTSGGARRSGGASWLACAPQHGGVARAQGV